MIINDSSGVNRKERGINRAEVKNELAISLFERKVEEGDSLGTCVFISHRSTDKDVAVDIAGYIRDCGIDVYIDVDDKGLQIATINNDSESIVNYIHEGLKQSTHVLALISDDTRDSWWVPYEIGYGEKANKKIASMLLEQDEVDFFPDYLKIVRRLYNTEDFIEFVKDLKRAQKVYGGIFESEHPIILPDISKVSKLIKEVNPN